MFELRELRNFVAVAERLNVSAAAKAVNLSQPALSRQIQSLESKLGVPLFERNGKRMVLTAEGEDLLKRAADLLESANALVNRTYGLKSGNFGLLRVGASPQTIASLVSPAMADFSREFPNIEISVSEGNNEELIEFVEHGVVHLGIAGIGVNPQLSGRYLFDTQLMAILPPGHPLQDRETLSITDIATDPMLIMQKGFLTRQLFDHVCSAHGIRPRILLESDSTHTLAALSRDGHGCALISTSARDIKEVSEAVPICSDLCKTSAEVSAVWHPNRYRPSCIEAFRMVLAKHCNQREDPDP
ncbi:LysR family transcriptional regulator [Rhodobacteraceae bacterium NNCM2]|nr:LysR family transcriptional regulator [Coraliihabitans acroporae]